MRRNLCAGTLMAVLVPPSLSALIGAEEAWLCLGGDGKFSTAVFATRLILGGFGGHAVSPAEGFDGTDRDAKDFRYSGICSFLFTHSYDLFLL